MDESAVRRVETIARHLCIGDIITNSLHPNPVSAASCAPVIIGGMVMDIHAKPSTDLKPGTTTPGTVRYISGGVARNIAECMSKLGTKPFIISAVGLDVAGDILLKYWESAGLATEGIRRLQGITTPIVSNIFDCRGELAAAVASVEAVEKFVNADWIQQFRHSICSAPLVMVDANLHPRALEAACQIATESGTPVWFEPVSVAKSTRIASVVNHVTCSTPNEAELFAMANALSSGGEFCAVKLEAARRKELSIESLLQMLKPAISLLLDKGIRLLLVTLGPDGVFLCFREGPSIMKDKAKYISTTVFGKRLYEFVNECCPPKQKTSHLKSEPASEFYAFHFPALPASVVSLIGAGDCLVGGILASICNGLDVMQSVAVGMAAAKLTVESESNVPPEYSLTTIAAEAQQIFYGAKPLSIG